MADNEGNIGVYEQTFLAPCRKLLNPEGALVVWSAAAPPELLATMHTVFGEADEQVHDVLLQDRPDNHHRYFARGSDGGFE